ncbi:MAG: 5-oxoprolinase subunit PxpB [Woeseiaceae bacterium]
MRSHRSRETLDARILVCGDDLLSVSLDDIRACQALADSLRNTGDWLESVAGTDSVVVQFDNATIDIDTATKRLDDELRQAPAALDTESALVDVPICYGGEFGPDLGDICEQLDLTRDEFVALHVGREYRVDMLGFTPGFAYVGGLDDALNVPRRKQPRVRVEAGSVGIADGRSGIYALAGPGGWPLIGRTPLKLFDASAAEPFRLHAGMRIRFQPVDRDEFDAIVETIARP